MTLTGFVKKLKYANFPDTFNPYRDRCECCDLYDAAQIRTRNFSNVLKAAADTRIDSLWIGRDLGYRGGRRTGLAFTDDSQLPTVEAYWSVSVRRSTKGKPITERTASVIWSALKDIEQSIFLWNVFPLHPHRRGQPFCNRVHNSKERQWGEQVLLELIELLNPTTLIPVGNDAASVARSIDDKIRVFPVRHPSYGGQCEFLKKIAFFYNS